MCFSAAASYTIAAALLPVGIYCYHQAQKSDLNQRFFAAIPFMFAIQQCLEGMLWQTIESGNDINGKIFALGYLFFSHFFWLIWIPFSCYKIEINPWRKNLFEKILIAGTIHGSLMYIPLLFFPEWMSYEITQHSINYHTAFFYEAYINDDVVRWVYAFIVLMPLFLSSEKSAQLFGLLVLAALIIAALFYVHAFISVWCYFAAVISFYIFLTSIQLKVRTVAINTTK